MTGALQTWHHPTLTVISNAIFLRELQDGSSPFRLQNGQVTSRAGLEAAHVSLSRLQASKAELTIADTFGPLFTDSSPSADLQQSLASRLQANLEGLGSPLYGMTLSQWAMPVGEPIFRLRASAHRISDNDSGGWPTPIVGDGFADMKRSYRMTMNKIESGSQILLGDLVQLTGWPTPVQTDAQERKNYEHEEYMKTGLVRGGYGLELKAAAQLTGWRSPVARTTGGGWNHNPETALKKIQNGNMVGLEDQASLAGWPTPTVQSNRGPTIKKDGLWDITQLSGWNTPLGGDSIGDANAGKDARKVNGLISNGCIVPTENHGQLNPEFVRWLMGFPQEWGSCAPTETP